MLKSKLYIKHCKPIRRRMTAVPPVLSPSSILLPSSHCAYIPARKNSARILENVIIWFFTVLKIHWFWNCQTWN